MTGFDMGAGDALAALGLYQVVDATWSFVVSCDWQCKPANEQTTAIADQQAAMQPTILSEEDAQLGLYQLVDPKWNFTVSCDWQCKPEDQQTDQVQGEGADESLQDLQEPEAKAPIRTKCNVPLSDSDARIGLYQMVDHRWHFAVSCDWQCKPTRRPKPKSTPGQQQLDSTLAETAVGSVAQSLSDADAQLGLYQLVGGGWDFVVSCEWQCRSSHDDATTRDTAARSTHATGDDGHRAVALSESDARLGLFQLVHPAWNFTVSCDWQCAPTQPLETARAVDEHGDQLMEAEQVSTTSSLSACREDTGRPSMFRQTGDIIMTLVGDEGDEGLVMIDELGSGTEQRLSPEVAVDVQAAEQRKRQLAQLVSDLGGDVSTTFTVVFNTIQYFT